MPENQRQLSAWMKSQIEAGFRAAGLTDRVTGRILIPLTDCLELWLILEWSGNCFIVGNYIDKCAQETVGTLKICIDQIITSPHEV